MRRSSASLARLREAAYRLRSTVFVGLSYAENQTEGQIYDVFPDFFDENGDSLPTDKPLPVERELPARMVVLFDEMREKLHRGRIREGIRFYCQEGRKRVAEGRVTRITGLFNEKSATDAA